MIKGFTKATMVATLAFGAVAATAATASAQQNLLNVTGQARIQTQSPAPDAPLFIDFLSGQNQPTVIGFGTPGNVYSGTNTGIFTSIMPGMQGTMSDVTVLPASVNTTPPGQPILQIGAYTFQLGPFVPASGGTIQFGPIVLEDRATGATADFLIRGTATGGACTPGCNYDGVLTAQFAGQTSAQVLAAINAGGTPVVTFSANFNATVIPEPSTYALMAAGLSALGLVARRRRVTQS